MTTIFFIRHGQTLWNKDFRYQGQSDIKLSSEGLFQAEKLARRLCREPFDAIYSSDLSRAVVTAEQMAAYHGLPVLRMNEFREVGFGQWEGLTFEEIKAKWPSEIEDFFLRAGSVIIPGGETFSEVQKRTSRGVGRILLDHPDQRVAVVSHGGAIRTLICSALGIPLDSLWSFRQDNTAVNVVEYTETRNVVRLLNDVHHLDDSEPVDRTQTTAYNVNRRF